ncbi:MAG: DNA starvation/stationary phase protection protein [Gemmataceae bacterium]|nr:DNA starvation/stationary phase protection protein [Gemmataceae bacterium]
MKATTPTAPPKTTRGGDGATAAHQPLLGQQARPLQPFGTVTRMPIGLDEKACQSSVNLLNQLLADSMALRDLYKKHHWQVAGQTFYQLHLLFDKHFAEQVGLIDQIAERVQMLGGVSVAMAHDVAEMTKIPRPPRDREEVPVQFSRLVEAHEIILRQAREGARKASAAGDDGTNDLLVSDVIRTHEMHVWFLAEHLVDTPMVRAKGSSEG